MLKPPATHNETAHILEALMDQREGVAVAVLKAAPTWTWTLSPRRHPLKSKLPEGISTVQNALPQPCRALRWHRPPPRDSEVTYVSTEMILLGVPAGTR